MSGRTIQINCEIHAPAAQVYFAFTNAMSLREWLCDVATVDPRPGGRFYACWNSGYYASGEYTLLDANREVGFTWLGRGEPGASQVNVRLKEEKGTTRLNLSHRVPGTGQRWVDALAGFQREWSNLFENLVSVLETGQDLRIARRPMLGINLGDFNAEQAKKLGVPVKDGLRLDIVVDGLGAKAVGLQKNDVLVGIDGTPITGYVEFSNIIQEHRAGDTISVEFYRGKEKQTAAVTLSSRPLPEIPSKVSELAEILKGKYQQIDAELAKLFEGVSEEQANRKPAPNEWSAKETVAHIIHAERENPSWINDALSGNERVADNYADNFLGRVAATAAAYSTVNELLQELKRNEAESLAVVAAIPEIFTQSRKGSFWRMAYQLINIPEHTRSHYAQISEAIKAGGV